MALIIKNTIQSSVSVKDNQETGRCLLLLFLLNKNTTIHGSDIESIIYGKVSSKIELIVQYTKLNNTNRSTNGYEFIYK